MTDLWLNLWFLAETEAKEGGGGILEFLASKNLVNFAIVLGVLFYVGKGVITKLLTDQRAAIEKELGEVEARRKQAEEELALQKRNLAQAQQEAANILLRAEENAKRVRTEILNQVDQEILRMRQDAQRELEAERERVVAQLRRLTLEQTFQKVEADLPGLLNDDVQRRLIDQGISLLERRVDHAG